MKQLRYVGHAGRFIVAGAISGERYIFTGHGAVSAVQAVDVAEMLAMRRRQRGCCGSRGTIEDVLFVEA